jgi:hypothetical protein
MNVISGVGHPRLDSVVSLVLRMVCCAMTGVLTLYYKSLGAVPTLLRIGNISGKPYMRVITYNALAFSCIKIFGCYRRYYTTIFY